MEIEFLSNEIGLIFSKMTIIDGALSHLLKTFRTGDKAG